MRDRSQNNRIYDKLLDVSRLTYSMKLKIKERGCKELSKDEEWTWGKLIQLIQLIEGHETDSEPLK